MWCMKILDGEGLMAMQMPPFDPPMAFKKKKGQQANKEQLRKGQIISPDPRTIGRGVPI